ncbi:hypothetical protein N1I81_22850 [Bacillus sp. FSL M8-0052]|uniref:hypothetical protein n=1 Tax=Bacillus sp. FSL M8-0052 TaxID=2978203 RepID=UPI0030FA7BC0
MAKKAVSAESSIGIRKRGPGGLHRLSVRKKELARPMCSCGGQESRRRGEQYRDPEAKPGRAAPAVGPGNESARSMNSGSEVGRQMKIENFLFVNMKNPRMV